MFHVRKMDSKASYRQAGRSRRRGIIEEGRKEAKKGRGRKGRNKKQTNNNKNLRTEYALRAMLYHKGVW